MTTLAANRLRDYQLGDKEEYPVIASDIIYQGAAVGENGSGYARPLVAADPFLGFAEAIADNSGGAAGAITVNVKAQGRIVLPIAGIAITANDRPAVYASDGGAEGARPQITARSADIPAQAAHGDAVTIDARSYRAVEFKPDGTGMTVVRLQE